MLNSQEWQDYRRLSLLLRMKQYFVKDAISQLKLELIQNSFLNKKCTLLVSKVFHS